MYAFDRNLFAGAVLILADLVRAREIVGLLLRSLYFFALSKIPPNEDHNIQYTVLNQLLLSQFRQLSSVALEGRPDFKEKVRVVVS